MTLLRWKSLVFCLLTFCFALPSFAQDVPVFEQDPLIPSVIQLMKMKVVAGERLISQKQLSTYYKSPEAHPIWIYKKKLNKQYSSFLKFIDARKIDGLNPENYHYSKLKELTRRSTSDFTKLAELEVLFTDASFTMVQDLSVGRVNPKALHKDWHYQPKAFDAKTFLIESLADHKLVSELTVLIPTDDSYVRMRNAIKYYQDLADKGGWVKVPKKGKKVEKHARGPNILALRQRLLVTGELKQKNSQDPEFYDDDLVEAVKKFQTKHGLNADGVIGTYTLEALNVSVTQKISQIRVNMERIRWLPKDMGDRYIFVNIPDYTLSVIEKGKTKLNIRSVVGNTKWRTPVFSDELEYLVINPRWNVPTKILKKEMLPKIQKDGDYITKKNFEVYKMEDGKRTKVDHTSVDWSQATPGDFLFSQRSGGGNALGRLKFIFPNKFSVYLHDTPSKYLFKRDVRAFSHGCIRVEKPLEMASYFLKGTEKKWNNESIKTAINQGQTRTVSLPQKIPVHLYYLTAWASSDGSINFRKDIYGYDKSLSQALNKR
jgi:L,D-transpeptidase YcbB